jgi:hypothetical protein
MRALPMCYTRSWNWCWIYDRQSVSQSVLVSGTHLGPTTNLSFLLEIFFRQLRLCYFVAPSLTRGRVCNLLVHCFWALPEQSLSSPSPAELTAIFYCLIWDSSNLDSQIPVFISPRNRVAQLYPRALGSLFGRVLRLTGLWWRYSNQPPHGSHKEMLVLFHLNMWVSSKHITGCYITNTC